MTGFGTGWCPECRARVEIADVTTAEHPTPRGMVETPVEQYACGHQQHGPDTVVADAPGEPDAGVSTAPTTTGRALRAARARARREGPW